LEIMSAPVPRAASYEIVVVTYFSRVELAGFLAGIERDIPIVVVDNCQGADHVDELLSDRPFARYISGPARGFATAANIGVRTSAYDVVIFANPDTRPTSDTFRALVACIQEDRTVGACAAATTDETGRIEFGVGGWEPNLARALAHSMGLHRLWPRIGLWARPALGEDARLDWLTGACLAVPRALFIDVGGFDERYFVYGEDVSYGRTLRQLGYKQLLRTDLTVPHGGAGSGGDRSTLMQLRGASMTSYLRRHNSRARADVIRIVLALGSAARLLVFCRRRPRAKDEWSYLYGLVIGPPSIAKEAAATAVDAWVNGQ